MKESTVSITKRDVLWGYVAQFFNFGASIILLPILLRFLSAQEVGIWYIFSAISSLLMMFDFGFLPTISRNVGYIFNGATQLQKEGIDENSEKLGVPNYPLLKIIKFHYFRCFKRLSGENPGIPCQIVEKQLNLWVQTKEALCRTA